MGKQKQEYVARVNKTLDYIEANLEKPLSLEELANVASFSKYHFCRIFQSTVGETPYQLILRLRLERAASILLTSKHISIAEVATRCGFSDLSIFSRSFKNRFNIPASLYRSNKNSNISQLASNLTQANTKPELYFCTELQTIKWKTSMKLSKEVEVKVLPDLTLAYVRNIGVYNGDQQLFQQLRDKLFTWAHARELLREDTKFIVAYHDNPEVATGEGLRMSLCLSVPSNTKVDGEIGKMKIEAAKYAIARFELTGSEFEQAWQWLYGTWMPESGYEPDDKPYFEMYVNPPQDGNYVVDFCIPVVAA